jgi:hypothetical protein
VDAGTRLNAMLYVHCLSCLYISTGVTWLLTLGGGGSKSTMGIRYFNLQKHQFRNSGEEFFLTTCYEEANAVTFSEKKKQPTAHK